MSSIARALTIASLVLLLQGCAPRSVVPRADANTERELARADALVAAGCYRCLEDALATYSRAGDRGRARAFDTAVLLALRQREVGIRRDDYLTVAAGLQDAVPADRARLLLDAVELVPWHPLAVSPEEREAQFERQTGIRDSLRPALEGLDRAAGDDLAASYLSLAVRCAWPFYTDEPDPAQPRAGAGTVLIAYRQATCARGIDAAALTALRQREPRFEELELFFGDETLAGGTLMRARTHYEAARRAIPSMVPASLRLGNIHMVLEEFEAAEREYARVLVAVPRQSDAMLGRARALGYLKRHEEAIASLSDMIDGRWLVGDAYYWRAWNHFQLQDLDAAERDVAEALALLVNARVHALDGYIKSARGRWSEAQRAFEESLALDSADCDVMLSLATALARLDSWPDAASRFVSGAGCLVSWQHELRRRLSEIASAEEMDERVRARFTARTEAALAQANEQEGLARLNAALMFANAGQSDEARRHARAAAAWPERSAQAASLLDRLGGAAP